ncbi:outer membrane lipid asymmetry maintenance protein MlaD [Sphingomonas montana]|uniref:outer membrane lipid asymmetry maintenance protein MlaD n=1 Tax=Sphingomonas montana TaxID=1843236 RepID=UPI00096C462D|nr:outer membrane lipid asymmetry maintenance protein MlaD [Sphingomonas montana]
MKTVVRENGVEALVGFAVLVVAIWFALFAWGRTGGGGAADAIHVSAMFPNASGVTVGTDVRVAGLKIGSVTGQKLDAASYQVSITLALDPTVKLPSDSSAAITSEGLLGGTFIALQPGGSTEMLKDGSVILDTQGSVDLMGLIGSFINRPAAPAADAPADAAATPTP